MKKLLLLAVAMLFSAAALAQYKWVDKDGKVRYGDTPPPGVKATQLRPPPPAAPPAAAKGKADAAAGAKDASAASKGPLTPAEKEAEFRKRQIEAQKASEKDKQALQEVQTRKQNCASAQETLRSMEGGQRIARTDAKGERHGHSVVQLISAPFNAS